MARIARAGLAALVVALHLTLVLAVAGAPSAAAAVGDVQFDGGGWGHGLGMSQWGARGFAANGWSYDSILRHYFQGTAVGPRAAPYDPLRVGLVWDAGQINGSTTAGALVGCSNGPGTYLPPGGFSYTPGLLRRGDNAAILACGGNMTLYYLPGVLAVTNTGHNYHHGALELAMRPGTALVRAIALITGENGAPAIDVYLYGLGEVPSSWPMETLKAQAAAGRTYALEKVERLGQHRTSPACDCALVASTLDQAYVGYDKETAAFGSEWVNAVNATRSIAITSNGSLIQAFYSSSSGGHTENNELVWGGTPLPYLRGVSDPYDGTGGNPNARWSVRMSRAELGVRLNASSSTAVGSFSSLEIVPPTGVSGRVTVVLDPGRGGARITGSGGVKRVSGETLRGVLSLKSTRFTLTNVAPPDAKTPPGGGYALAGDGALVPFGSAPEATGGPTFAGDIARALTFRPGGNGAGYLLDGHGGVHPFNGAPAVTGLPGWPGWDIARDVVLRRDGQSGYVLDGLGGVHPFGGAPSAPASLNTAGADVARRLVLADDDRSGYVLTTSGGVHPFGGLPAVMTTSLASGRVATGLLLLPGDRRGYVLDDVGALYAFGADGLPPALPAWPRPTVAIAGRADGPSGYTIASDGAIYPFGGAPNAATKVGGFNARDIELRPAPSGYVLDGFGGLHPFNGAPPVTSSAGWPGWDIARRAVVRADGAGYVLDGWGGIHPFGTSAAPAPPAPAGGASWPGWDIARDLVLLNDRAGAGYVLDGFGGLHAFGGAPAARVTATWPGWDIARGVALNPDGNGGYVLDGWGGLHPFAVGTAPLPPPRSATAWPGWDIARAVTLTGANAGFTVDGYGATHGFGGAAGSGSWYWGGTDLVAGAEADRAGHGWVVYVDRWGGLHTSPEPTPAVETTAYWPGWSIARDVALT